MSLIHIIVVMCLQEGSHDESQKKKDKRKKKSVFAMNSNNSLSKIPIKELLETK